MKKQSTILLIAPITILLVVVLILPLLAVLLPTVFEGGEVTLSRYIAFSRILITSKSLSGRCGSR